MKILLTMAGLGSRFKTAGYELEKFEIPFRGHTLLEWSIASLARFREFPLVFITRDFPDIEKRASQLAQSLGFQSEVIVLDAPTRGQAETAIKAESVFQEDDSILIFNTDTFVDPNSIRPKDIRGSGWIPTFAGEGDKWSFAEADANGRASRTTEKVRISSHASVGIYYFDSFYRFREIAQSAETNSELYVAPLYNDWIRQGGDVYIQELPKEAVTILGTPEDLELAEAEGRPIWPEGCFN